MSYSIDQSKLDGPLYRIEISSSFDQGYGGPGAIYQGENVPAHDTISKSISLYPGEHSLFVRMMVVYLVPYMRNGMLVTDEYSMTNVVVNSPTVTFFVFPISTPKRLLAQPTATIMPNPTPAPSPTSIPTPTLTLSTNQTPTPSPSPTSTPSPSVPEFPTWTALSMVGAAALLTTLIVRRSRKTSPQSKEANQ